MRRTIQAGSAVLVLCFIAAGPAPAADTVEVAGVSVPGTVQVADEKLALNGAGLREVAWFDVYVGGLYVREPSRQPAEVVAQEGPKRIHMWMLRDVERQKLVDAWNEGFKNNMEPEKFGALADRIETFNSYFPDAEEGDEFVMDYIPGEGTRVSVNGKVQGTIPGRDFHEGLLLIWLGDSPPSDEIREGMLGKG